MHELTIEQEQLVETMLEAVNQAAHGEYTAAHQTFMEAAAKADSALLKRFVEALELFSVKVEAHEYSLQLAKQALAEKADHRFKVAVFDSKSYTETFLLSANARHDFALHFFTERLKPDTVALATGFQAICIFVNDVVTASVAKGLAALGVELIALRCAGYNNVDLAACEALGISVVRVPAYSPHAVAEHAVALMMALNRKIHRACRRVQEGNFSLEGLIGFTMRGCTAGIVGAGNIGVCTIEILHGFGCRLLVHTRTLKPELSARLGVEFVSLPRLLAESDVVTLHVPLTPETYHIIDAPAVAQLKPGMMLINTSRGGLIDTSAVLDGLKNGRIGAAGLDVYEEESEFFFEDHSNRVVTDDALARLTTFNNVIITGHQGFLTHEALTIISDTTLNSIAEFQAGRRGHVLTHYVAPRGIVSKGHL